MLLRLESSALLRLSLLLILHLLCGGVSLSLATADTTPVAATHHHQACLEYGLDYEGQDMENGLQASVLTAEDCQKLCKQRSGCHFFTWSPPTDQDCPICRNTCWLKTGNANPQESQWRVSGPAACQKKEKLVFQEEFDSLDEKRWQHMVTGWRGGNNEFQYYRNHRKNSYASDGKLVIKPSFTETDFDEEFLYKGSINLWDEGCTQDMNVDGGCDIRAGVDIVNPIQSARMRTANSFSFRYGRLEVSAKMPRGDWLWPSIWLLPEDWKYGNWPRSGEIDLVEGRGNDDLVCRGANIGNKHVVSALHWGLSSEENRWQMTSWGRDDPSNPYSESFHKYELEWSENYIAYKVDGVFIGAVRPPNGGFWKLGGFRGKNLWASGSKMAPFDQNFHIILNLAVGGDFFPDGCSNGANGAKPWVKGSPTSMRNFWEKKGDWEKTWGGVGSDQSALQIDYIRVYQRVD